ncbi:alcohol dehydrogenase [Schizopora paradoxa]|uniref:Alcohol dehydrogenase n=1 Tax=Schizopora paradoxa TaxID=27342 RepID=A0A0H2RZZ8_9AGAM|nr:alcohol dehydrogenase [Schizopora paradoxa]
MSIACESTSIMSMSRPPTYIRVVLANRPETFIDPDTFIIETKALGDLQPSDTHVAVRVDYISLDPAMRGWINEKESYVSPVEIGETMRAFGIGTVVKVKEGKSDGLKVGDVVKGQMGWTEYNLLRESELMKLSIQRGLDAVDYLGPLGHPGFTAYFGLLDVGKIKAGETLLVSGAAGAVGSLVCQIGKLKGCRVIAIAGSQEKCDWLEKELGVDKALNYKDEDFYEKCKGIMAASGPRADAGGWDVYFDNVGGDVSDFMLTRMRRGARVALCGIISQYNTTKPTGLTSYMNLISMRAKIEGFLVMDYAARFAEAEREMAQWILEGKLKRKFHIVEGLAKAPESINLLFTGGNTGKLIVKVSRGEERHL